MDEVIQVIALLAAHADLIKAVVEAVEGGTPKDAIAAAIKAAKKATSDVAFKEELGIDPGFPFHTFTPVKE